MPVRRHDGRDGRSVGRSDGGGKRGRGNAAWYAARGNADGRNRACERRRGERE